MLMVKTVVVAVVEKDEIQEDKCFDAIQGSCSVAEGRNR
jgi:hypothetical protein